MSEEKQPESIYSAWVRAQKLAINVGKGGWNDFHKYKYASSEDVIARCSHHLGECGLGFSAVNYRVENDALHAEYLLVHGDSGDTVPMSSSTPIVVEKSRPADKATATAKTYDLAYMLRGVLLLARQEEGTGVDNREDPKNPRGKGLKRKQEKVTQQNPMGGITVETKSLTEVTEADTVRVRIKAAADALGPEECKSMGFDRKVETLAEAKKMVATMELAVRDMYGA